MKAKALVIYGEGLNSEEELADAFIRAGADAHIVHIQSLVHGETKLKDYHIFAIPGGFSFGDHLGSGKLFALMLTKYLKKDIEEFLSEKKLILGVCNGFQVLAKMGLLPFAKIGEQVLSLSFNESLRYEDRWVRLKVNEETPSIWLKGIDYFDVPVRHGEGRIVFADSFVGKQTRIKGLNALLYVDENLEPTLKYPENPNGSPHAIAGLCDPSGLVLGLMPHPEVARIVENAPGWQDIDNISQDVRKIIKEGDGAGLALFYNGVSYVEDNLL